MPFGPCTGIAIRCTGVGPSINPNPNRLSTSPTTASTRSVSSPSFDHSSVPSVILPLLSIINIEGRESSNDERGAQNGDDDHDPRLNTAAAAATGDDDDAELDVVVEYGSFDDETVS